MRMRKPPTRFLIDRFEYHEYNGVNDWNEAVFKQPILISKCRVDSDTQFIVSGTGKSILYNAIIFCFGESTTPMLDFKERSKVVVDNQSRIITKVVKNKEPFLNDIYSYELEVI